MVSPTTTAQRGTYGEIRLSSINPTIRKQVENLFNQVSNAKKVDEHGSWEFGASFDRKGRGAAINYDYYAIGRDYFSKQLMIVLQVRKFERRFKNGFGNVQKSYFLCGRNEDNFSDQPRRCNLR